MTKFIKKIFSSQRRIALGIVLLVVAGFVVKNTFFTKPKPPETAKVTRGNLQEKLTISGKVQAEEDTLLSFQTGGQLAWVGVKVGDKVKKYQGVASLDQRQVQKNITKTLNTYEKTRDTFENTQTTYKDETLWTDSIRRILHGSQMDLNNSVIDVEIQDLAKKFANLWSPINGLVVRADALYPGVNVAPLVTSYEIVNPETVYLSISADQTEVTKLTEGLQGTLVLDSYPDKTLEGEITQVSFVPEATSTDTVYKVKFHFTEPNSDYRYKVGMTGDVTFTTKVAPNALYVPTKFVKSDGEKQFVNILKAGKKEKAVITTGLETDQDTQITSGVSEGDTVSL